MPDSELGVVHFGWDDSIAADAPLRAAHEFLAAYPMETRYGLNRGVDVAAIAYAARPRSNGDLAPAEQDLLDVMAIAERRASPFDWIFACIAAGEVNELAGRLAEAAVWFDRALTWGDGQRTADAGHRRPAIWGWSRRARARWAAGVGADGAGRRRYSGFRMFSAMSCPSALQRSPKPHWHRATSLRRQNWRSVPAALGATIEDPTAAVLALLVMGHSLRQSGRKPAQGRFRAALEIAEAHHLAQFAARCREALDALSTKGRIDPRGIRHDKVSAT